MQAHSPTSLVRSLQIQGRILYALLMREIITRYGRHNIGFAWLFGEPMLFTSGIVALWTVMNLEGGSSRHINIMAYAITSYSTVIAWRNTIGRCSMAIEPNRSLLVHRNVRPIDFFISRIALELTGATLAVLAMLGVFMLLGLIPFPANVLLMVVGWLLICWYAAAMALLIGGGSEFSEIIERLWHPLAYFQIPVSGGFAMAAWLPAGLRHIVLLFPVANAVEVFRYGYFGDQIRAYYDIPYICTVNLILTWLGLYVANAASRKIDAQ